MEMQAFYAQMAADIANRSVIHANGQCQIWMGSMKQGTEYGVIRYKDPRDGPVAGHRSKGVHRMTILVSDSVKDLDVPPAWSPAISVITVYARLPPIFPWSLRV